MSMVEGTGDTITIFMLINFMADTGRSTQLLLQAINMTFVDEIIGHQY